MSVRLRLRRMGKKKQPIYKVVAADSRSPRDGKFLEAVGIYNPLTKPHTVDLKEERVFYWLDKGAQPTDTVKSLFRQNGITLKREMMRKGKSEEEINSELENRQKLREAKTASKPTKKKSKKALAAEQKEKEVSKVSNEQSTAEVKGAASEENPAS
ncbi:MAG TPA: 30S ribosomal protein S16 [Ignavibacteriaceae bacterium]|nr:30S ribosomal protein S16 [Ignavibacteriaceae bacterium]